VRFGGAGGDTVVSTLTPLRVEGAIRHPDVGEAWEYAVMITITNDRGEETARQIVGVGAIPPGEQRKFSFSVEVFTPAGAVEQDADVKPGVKALPKIPSASR
jgi:hypothetical protein